MDNKSSQIKFSRNLLGLLIFAAPFYFIRFSIGPIPTTLLEVLIYIVFVYFVFSGSLNLSSKTKPILAAGVFVAIALIGAFADPQLMRGLGLWKAYFFDGFLVYLMFLSADNKEDFAKTLFYSAVLVAVLSLIMFALGVKTTDGRLLDLERLSPNYLAMLLTPTVIIGAFVASKSRRIWDWLGEIAIFMALVLTNSRGALVALLGALIILIYYYLKTRRKTWSVAALSVMLIIFFAGGYLVFKPDWSDQGRKATSSNIRYYIWSTSLEMIGKNPVTGVGLGNYQDYFKELTKNRVNYPEFITPEALTAHNIYLHLYLTVGLLGLLGFVHLMITSKFYFLKTPVFSLALFSILFYSLVDTPFYRNDLSIIFWIILALSTTTNRNNA